jgi:hypothetical protein
MPDQSLDPELAALSAALGGLAPAPPAIDRDRLLFEAGRRSIRRPWASPILTGLFAVLSAGLCVRLATVPAQIQVVYVDRPSQEGERPDYAIKPPVADAPGSPLVDLEPRPAAAKYLQLRDQVVRFGVDSLPHVTSASSPVNPPVEKMLGLPAGTLDDGQKSRWEHQLFQGGV